MKELIISILPNVVLVVSLAAIFIVLLVTILKILRAVSFFQGAQVWIMAVSVALLCILGMVAPVGTYNSAHSDSRIEVTISYLPLSYTAPAVAVAIILSQVILLASRASPSEEAAAGAEKSEPPLAVRSKSPGRPKKEKSAEKELKDVAKPVGSSS
jgi:hypothetical protein